MHRRPNAKYSPVLERLEAKQLLSVGPSSVSHASHRALASHPAATSPASAPNASPLAVQPKPNFGYLVYRITNPNRYNYRMRPPFSQVLVQSQQPVPGQVYNLLYVVVRNGTAQDLRRKQRVPGQDSSIQPILPDSDRERAMEARTEIRLLYTHQEVLPDAFTGS